MAGLSGWRVACAVSGGVDSTVSAWLLKQRGFRVEGVFMRNWDLRDELGVCTANQDAGVAADVCERLDIPFQEVNLVKDYWHNVFQPLVEDYERGLTPNPDILCNARIKFGPFLRYCLDQLGVDAVATGHYARLSGTNCFPQSESTGSQAPVQLLQAHDLIKDQTFFLSRVPAEAFRRVLFPIGHLPKTKVKQIAVDAGFSDIARQKESMGICFIGKRKKGFQDFLRNYVDDQPGDIVDQETGKVLGRHRGVHMWTIGQSVPLSTYNQRIFVSHKCVASRRLTVVRGTNHPALYTQQFNAAQPFWINGPPPELSQAHQNLSCHFRFQNNQPLTACQVNLKPRASGLGPQSLGISDSLSIHSEKPLRAVAPGQHAVFYSGEVCLGSAIITEAGDSLHDRGTASLLFDNKG